MTAPTTPITTPDGRYLIVRGRLWRTSNPHMSEEARVTLVSALRTHGARSRPPSTTAMRSG